MPPAHGGHVGKANGRLPCSLLLDLSNPTVSSQSPGSPGGLEPREEPGWAGQARQRALSARGARRGGRGPRGAVATPLSCLVTAELQYSVAVECGEPTIAKALI